jgi:hypothetical protein
MVRRNTAIEATVPCYRDYINRWRKRFPAKRLEGLRPQVELWFAKIERDLLARDIFTSVADLARKIRQYIGRYNKAAKPIPWSYSNPKHRISSTSVSTVH